MDDDLKMNYNETDENKSQKELVRKAHKILHGTSDKEKIKKALKEIDELIKHYERMKTAMKEGLADARIEDLVGIKKILEAY